MPIESAMLGRMSSDLPTSLLSRRFIAAIVTLGAMQLMATMDSTIAAVALPTIQNELDLSDAGRSWVLTAYVLAFGGLMLVGGRVGDTIGRKRAFIVGVALFTIASAVCGIAWNGAHPRWRPAAARRGRRDHRTDHCGAGGDHVPEGAGTQHRDGGVGRDGSVSTVLSLVVGGALADVSWRLIFLVNVPIGLLVIYLARTTLRETQLERMKLDVTGAGLATFTFIAAVVAISMGPEKGWLSAPTIGFGCGGTGRFRGVRRGGAHRREPHRAV